MSEQNMDSITNNYPYEYNYFNEQDSAFERKLMEEDQEKFSMGVEELTYLLGE